MVEDMVDQDMAEGLEDREGAAKHDGMGEKIKCEKVCEVVRMANILMIFLRGRWEKTLRQRVSTSSASTSLRLLS